MRAEEIGATTAAAPATRLPLPRQGAPLRVVEEPCFVDSDIGRTLSSGEVSAVSTEEEEEDQPSTRHVSKSETHDLGCAACQYPERRN